MKLKILITSLLFIIYSLGYSQIGGRSVYQFLNLMTSPRQAALGGKVITINDYDVNQAIYNPATINGLMHNNLAANYGSYYGEVNYGTAAYAYSFGTDENGEKNNTFNLGVTYINYGDFEGRDEFGQLTSDFTGNEMAFSVGYAYKIPETNLFLGVNGKLISSTLESYNSFGGALDLGAFYITPESNLKLALTLRNIGTQFSTYAGTNENLPFEVIFGISKELENIPVSWHITLDQLQQWDLSYSNPVRGEQTIDGTFKPEKVSVFNNALRHLSAGVELFPKKSFNLRLGYNFRRGEELKIEEQRAFAGISAGLGIKFNNIRFSYSYSRYTLAANTNLFGLMIQL